MILLNRRKYIHRRRPQGAPADLADAVVTLASETVYYTGNPVYPSVSVTYEGAALVVNTDYTLNYTDNTEIGAATVTVTGMGEYTGQVVKTFQIVSSGGGTPWADFDLADLGNAEDMASLRDSTAYYAPGADISLYGIQTLPDDSIFFAAQAQGHPYVWGFDDGHAFEVAHFKSTFTSRGRVTVAYRGGTAGDGGTLLYDTNLDIGTGIYKTILDAAYTLSTENTRTFIGNAGLLGTLPCRMQFSHDGSKLFYKDESGTFLFNVNLSTPWDVSSAGEYASFNLAGLSSLPAAVARVYAFQFSPDGKALVFTCESNEAYQVDRKQYILKLSLSTAYDLSSATVHSYKQLSSGGNWWQGVAVNNAGTKLLLFKWNDTTRVFYEYSLSA